MASPASSKATEECVCFCLRSGRGFCAFLCMCVCVCHEGGGAVFFLSFFVLSFLFLFNLVGKSGRDRLPTREKTLPTGEKQAWLEVGNYSGGDKRAGQIRGPRFSSTGKSPEDSSEWGSTRTAHAVDMKTHQPPFLCCSFTPDTRDTKAK